MTKRKIWTQREEEILEKLWHEPQVSRQDIIDVFPGRKWTGIRAKASNMGLPPRASVETNINEELLSKLMKVVDG